MTDLRSMSDAAFDALYCEVSAELIRRRTGWACPDCGVVHSPDVDRCECKPVTGKDTPNVA